jgi:hypothetical protein
VVGQSTLNAFIAISIAFVSCFFGSSHGNFGGQFVVPDSDAIDSLYVTE